jgi:hypothetical protein
VRAFGFRRWIIAPVLAPAIGLLLGARAVAQTADTAALARYIPAAGTAASSMLRARGYLADRMNAGDLESIRTLLFYMAHHPEWRSWIAARELLLARIAVADLDLIRGGELTGLLDAAQRERTTGEGRRSDELLGIEQARVRNSGDTISARLERASATTEEGRFFSLLMNHLLVNAYRARVDLNRQVESFVAEFPAGRLAPIAQRYFHQEYRDEEFGAAFSASYILGRFLGNLSDRFDFLHGPTLSGELYIRRITILGSLTFGVAHASRPYTAVDGHWDAGTAPSILGSLTAGYELRSGLVAFTPFAGLGFQSMRAPGDDDSAAMLPRTGGRVGFEVGGILGYRIPFDIGAHIDLRARVGLSTATLGDYDPGFRGAFYYAGIGFALVHRPYRSVW